MPAVLAPGSGVTGRATLLFSAQGLAISSSGASASIDIAAWSSLMLLATAAAGTTPNVQLGFDVQDNFGSWLTTTLVGAAITTVPTTISGAIAVTAAAGRVSWFVTGGSLTGVNLSLFGRR